MEEEGGVDEKKADTGLKGLGRLEDSQGKKRAGYEERGERNGRGNDLDLMADAKCKMQMQNADVVRRGLSGVKLESC